MDVPRASTIKLHFHIALSALLPFSTVFIWTFNDLSPHQYMAIDLLLLLLTITAAWDGRDIWSWRMKHQRRFTELENNTGQRVKIIHIDGSRELINGPLKDWLKKKGITLKILAPDTHQQNGVAKCFNEMTHKCGLSMLKEASMSDGFWLKAHQYSNHTHNRSPTKVIPISTPYEVFYNKKQFVAVGRAYIFSKYPIEDALANRDSNSLESSHNDC